MHSELLNLLGRIAELEEKEAELINSSFKPLTLSKGEFFLKSNEVNKHIAFLSKASLAIIKFKTSSRQQKMATYLAEL